MFHDVLDDDFFIIIEEAYLTHLSGFGRSWATQAEMDKKAYDSHCLAFSEYRNHLIKKVDGWA